MGRKRKYDRDAVLDGAMDQFGRYGFKATSIADISAATGMNTASMYSEFGDKDGLFEATLIRYRDSAMTPRIRILAENSNLAGVMAFLKSVVTAATQPDYSGCLIMNHLTQRSAISPRALEIIDGFCEAAESLVETALRNSQEAGEIPADRDPAILASYIMCCIHGLVLFGRQDRKKTDIPKLYDSMVRVICD